MRKSYMREVAAIFHKALYEPFVVRNSIDKSREVFRFTEDGTEHFNPGQHGSYTIMGVHGDFCRVDYILDTLCRGQVWIEDKEEMEQGSLF